MPLIIPKKKGPTPPKKLNFNQLAALAAELNKQSSMETIEHVIREMARAELSPLAKDKILSVIRDRTGIRIKPLRHQLALAEQELGIAFSDPALALAREVRRKYFKDGAHLLRCVDGSYWEFNVTHWQEISDDGLCQLLLREATAGPLSTSNLNGFIGQAKGLLDKLMSTDVDVMGFCDDPSPVINCKNGELWLDKNGKPELRPHRPESRLTYCLPVAYDPAATCMMYDAALAEIFGKASDPANMVRHWNEFFGYAVQSRRHIACFWLLIGDGSNGKGSLLATLQRFVGPDAVLNDQIGTFQNDRFNIAFLRGKLLFIDDDVAKDTHLNDGLLKKISEAKDMSARTPHGRKKFRFRCLALPIMASNSFPHTADNSYGLRRRAQVIPFERIFGKHEIDTELFEKIWATEMPGILNRALEGLQRLSERRNFKLPEDCQRAVDDFMASANALVGFIDEACAVDPAGHIDLPEFRAAMRAWMSEQGMKKPAPYKALKRQLKGLGYVVTDVQGYPRVNGLRFKGVPPDTK